MAGDNNQNQKLNQKMQAVLIVLPNGKKLYFTGPAQIFPQEKVYTKDCKVTITTPTDRPGGTPIWQGVFEKLQEWYARQKENKKG